MLKTKKVLLVIGGIALLTLSTAIAYAAGTFSVEAEKWFAANCNNTPKPVKGINAAVCDIRERLITLEDTEPIPGPPGPQGEPGLKGEQGIPGTPGQNYHVYDANNQNLGVLLSAPGNGDISTYLPTLNRNIEFGLTHPSPSQVGVSITISSNDFYYEQPNCAGTPMIQNTDEALNILQKYNTPSKFYRTINSTAGSRVYTSRDNGIECTNLSQQVPTLTIQVEEVTLPFSTPIAWPLEIR